MYNRLKDRVAIISGAAQGMGFAIARAIFDEGAKVVIVDLDGEAADAAAKSLDQQAGRALGRRVDVTDKSRIQALIQEVTDAWGGIDILVNNAGGALFTPHILADIEEKDWNLVVDVNLKGAFFLCQAVIPAMVKRGGGAIVNISALAAHWRASLAGVQYTAAKAGVEGLTRQLAYDWGKAGIRVNAVAPTVTLTGDRVKGLWESKGEDEKKKVLSAIPLGRLSTPDEIASVVVFLAGDESSYVTGITIDVCGGRYLR